MSLQSAKPVMGLVPVADAFDGTKSTATVNLKNFNELLAIILKGAGATGTSTITVEKCSASNGTGNEAIPFYYRRVVTAGTFGDWTLAAATGFVTTAGASESYEVYVNGQMGGLAEGDKPFVRVTAVEVVNDPVTGAIYLLAGQGRYADKG